MTWKMTPAGDWELKLTDKRYRIEEYAGRFWLYEKPFDESPYFKLLGSYSTLEDAKEAVE